MTYRCVKNIYSCNKRVCCSGFFVIALVAVPVSSVRYTQCVSILAHNALSRARWNNDTIRSPIAVRQPMICSTVLSPFFPPHFDNAPRKRSSIFPTFFRFNDRGKWFLAPSCPCDTLARVTSFSTVLTFVKNAKSVNLVHNFFSLEQSRRLCAIVSGSLSFFFFFFFLFSPPDRRLER